MSLWTSLEAASVPVEPGGTATTTVRLRNDGDTVEEYQLSVVGAPAAWATVEPRSVRLFPGTRGQAQVTFQPPRSPEAIAGVTPYGIRVVSRENAALFDVVEGSVRVGAYGDVRAELFPITVRGRLSGRPGLTVRNLGNSWLEAALAARDDEDVLDFRPTPALLRIPPGGSATAELKILPRGLRLLRGPSRHQYAAAVVPTAAGVEGLPDRLEPRGTFVRLPTLPRLLTLLLALLLVGAALGSGIYFAATGNNNGDQAPKFVIGTPGSRQRLVAVNADITVAGDSDQTWTVTDTGDNLVALAPSGIAAAGLTQGDRNTVVLARVDGSPIGQQRWRLDQDGGIVNSATGDCLTTNGDGRRVTAEECDGNAGDRQKWTLTNG